MISLGTGWASCGPQFAAFGSPNSLNWARPSPPLGRSMARANSKSSPVEQAKKGAHCCGLVALAHHWPEIN